MGKVWIISVQDNLVGSWIMDSNFVVRKAVDVMKIEDKNDICAFKNNDFVIFRQIPLSSGMLIRTIISSPWKVQPLWMSKLIAHKIQVPFTSHTMNNQSDHLMQSNPTIHNTIGI